MLLVGTPLLALTQPFLPGVSGAAVLALLVLVLGVAFWRSATNLQGHVRAGAEVILEALAAQSRPRPLPTAGDSLEQIGRTLAQLNLRGRTGATILAITRTEGGVLVPAAHELLRAGDVLAVAGTHDAIEAAKAALSPSP